jgi:hypothetical protein
MKGRWAVCFIEVDTDPVSFSKTVIVKAKKQHLCGECGAIIKPGEKYEYSVIKSDDMGYFKTCLPCAEIRDAFCCTWIYESVWDIILEEISYVNLDIGCLDGLSKEAVSKFLEKYNDDAN